LVETSAQEIRLSEDEEWIAITGQTADSIADRYLWDPPERPATEDETAIRARGNTREAGLGGPSPVAMYPLGSSVPFGLMDLAGNVWEWIDT
jgi:formylglycine-generating enzyme required for sulfatase activity